MKGYPVNRDELFELGAVDALIVLCARVAERRRTLRQDESAEGDQMACDVDDLEFEFAAGVARGFAVGHETAKGRIADDARALRRSADDRGPALLRPDPGDLAS